MTSMRVRSIPTGIGSHRRVFVEDGGVFSFISVTFCLGGDSIRGWAFTTHASPLHAQVLTKVSISETTRSKSSGSG